MAGEIATAYVRLRPNTTGFQAEAAGEMGIIGRNLGKIFSVAFAAGFAAEGVKAVVEAATEHQAAFAVLARTIEDAGAANTLYGQSIESLLEKEARLKGFSDEELASAFQRLVSVTHDSGKAFDDLQKAEDLARFRHIDLATAATALSKALQGSATSLTRYGIIVPKVTADEDALRLAHDRLIASGAKFTETEKEQYAALLDTAKGQDKAATSAAALALVTQRTGGVAATFAKTAAGQFERLGVDLHQLEVAVGTGLIPVLTGAAEALGTFFQKESDNQKVQKEVADAAQQVAAGFKDVKSVVETLAPPLGKVADQMGGFVRVGEALAAVIFGKKLVVGLHAWATEEKAVGVSTAGTGVAFEGLTAAVEANTAALLGNVTAAKAGTVIYGALGEELAVVATEETAVGVAAAASATKVTGLSLALSRLRTLGIIGITVVAGLEIGKEGDRLANFLGGTGVGKALGLGNTTDTTFLDELSTHPISAAQADKLLKSGLLDPVEAAAVRARKPLEDAIQNTFQGAFDFSLTEPKKPSTILDQWAADLGNATKVAARNASEASGQAIIETQRQTLDGLQQTATDSATSLVAAIASGTSAIQSALVSAKQNLASIGSALTQELGAFLDANPALTRLENLIAGRSNQEQKQGLQGTLKADIAALAAARAGISLAGPETSAQRKAINTYLAPDVAKVKADQRAIGDFILQNTATNLQKHIALSKTAYEREVQDQIAAFNLGPQTPEAAKKLTAQITGELKKGGVTFASIRKEQGLAAAEAFFGSLTGLGEQAGALTAGPTSRGSGLIPSITRPLDALKTANQQIASAQKSRDAAALAVSKQQTKLLKEIAGQRKITVLLTPVTGNAKGN